MEKYIRPVAIGTAIGGIAAALFLGLGQLPSAIADEGPAEVLTTTMADLTPHRFNPDDLVKIGDDTYAVTADTNVSLIPLSTRTVRKIGYGKLSLVTISTTSSGVYSSDAMTSPHIRYPGIHVQRILSEDGEDDPQRLAYWSPRRGWVPASSLSAGSFVAVSPLAGGIVVTDTFTTCVLTDTIAVC